MRNRVCMCIYIYIYMCVCVHVSNHGSSSHAQEHSNSTDVGNFETRMILVITIVSCVSCHFQTDKYRWFRVFCWLNALFLFGQMQVLDGSTTKLDRVTQHVHKCKLCIYIYIYILVFFKDVTYFTYTIHIDIVMCFSLIKFNIICFHLLTMISMVK